MTAPTPPVPQDPTWRLLAQARLKADSAAYAARRVADLMADFARVVAERDAALAEIERLREARPDA